MLATTDLWFRYQDEPVLKGLTLDSVSYTHLTLPTILRV